MAVTKMYTEEVGEVETKLAEEPPEKPLSKCRVILLNLSFFATSASNLILCIVVVPAQIEAMVGGASKGRVLGGMVAGSAILMFIFGPLIGMKSDRLVSRFGRRRPIMAISMFFFCISMIGLAFSAPEITIQRHPATVTETECEVDLVAQRCLPFVNTSGVQWKHVSESRGSHPVQMTSTTDKGNLGLYVVFFLLTMVSLICYTVPYNALIADKTAQEERGFNSGVMGFMTLIGNITGALLGLYFVEMGVFVLYGCICGIFIICTAITLIATPETPGKAVHGPLDWKGVFVGFWSPLAEHDFRWVFATRFLMQQGIATVTGFLEFWLGDMVELPNCWTPHNAVGILLLPLLFTAAIGSIVFGFVSDRLQKRKPLVMIAGFLMCVAAFVMGLLKGKEAFYVSIAMSILFGLGFGIFQSVDFALVMDVLSENSDKAKDIAVWHQALILPQAIATPIGGFVLDIFESANCEIGLGYIMLFVISSIYFLLSGIFILKIRKAN